MKKPGVEHRESGLPRLSAHEMAALMLLGYASVKVEAENLDMNALHDAGLAQRIDRGPGCQAFLITSEGRDMLRVLGALTAPGDVAERFAAPDTF
ncbi:hypothetical protein [Burkholderia vietnamiensis]|uniref:hypothetical protein n=1 Tax=Burkholderia vietnamiensis TaxID=60552 RepID=UPI001593C3C6|nr:hypothetical protein [Burkholderia vietnamiensis]MBR8165672.1 hypothetical protein [Burkholderia vietnamiensis]UEC05352.1 hypothetical protein LK462_33690 [Burkholderia vietnamiensis]